MKIRFLVITILINVLFIANSFAQKQMERLDRGVHAIKLEDGIYVSWRILGTEWDNISFNLYRDGVKLNDKPITEISNYFDSTGIQSSSYFIRAIIDGIEQEQSKSITPWENSYLDIPVKKRNGYDINDASVGDLDGDGDYEIVVKRLVINNVKENQNYHYLEAYHLDGTLMWEINLGPNLFNAVEVNFLVYDLDGDGKAEIATRTSEGTIDGTGTEIPDLNGDKITNYRNSISYYEYRAEGPDFISIFDGETGKEITRNHYISLSPISQWGLPGMNIDQYSHRGTKCMWTVAYLDGKTPSFVISRGIYEKIVLEAWQFKENQLTKLWQFDTDNWPGFNKQGNHNLSLADVDSDGKDEVIYGSMVVDDDGTGLYTTQFGHGDALHVSDMDPDNPGLEIFQCLESSPYWGLSYREAENGNPIVHFDGGKDWGRCCAGDITVEYKGMEVWGGSGNTFWDCKGNPIGQSPSAVNFMIWWDGDLLREFLDHNWLGTSIGAGIGTISKYNGTASLTPLLVADGTYSNNYTKGTPCLSADILGDWREEVIWRSEDNSFMRIYSTPYLTSNKMYTLMHDPQYRAAIGWQNNSYNQPPHPGFYLGHDMEAPPEPGIVFPELNESSIEIELPWKNINIGNIYTNSSIKQNNNDFEIKSSGKSISSKYDNFDFISQQILGNGEIFLKIEKVESDSSSASAGIMFRESNNTSSKYISISYAEGYGLVYQFRDDSDKSASSIVVDDISLPVWLKMERAGDLFTIYSSDNGDSWNKVTKKTLDFSNNAIIGFFAVAAETSNFCNATLKNVQISGIQGGGLLLERWNRIEGSSISNLINSPNYPHNPDASQVILSSETPIVNAGENFGIRVRGYVVPTKTGNYAFHISGKDSCKLFLGKNVDDNEPELIAVVPEKTAFREWDKYPEQTSDSIYLVDGQKYYIEILHKASDSQNYFSVAWSGQGYNKEIIENDFLSPYILASNQQTAIDDIQKINQEINIFPNPAKSILNIEFPKEKKESFNLRIYDIRGSLQIDKNYEGNTSIDISSLKRGLYIIYLFNENFNKTEKIALE